MLVSKLIRVKPIRSQFFRCAIVAQLYNNIVYYCEVNGVDLMFLRCLEYVNIGCSYFSALFSPAED